MRPEDEPGVLLQAQTEDQPGPYSGPYEAAGVWAVLSGLVCAVVLWAGRGDLALIRRGQLDPDGRRKTESALGLALFGLLAALIAGLVLAIAVALRN